MSRFEDLNRAHRAKMDLVDASLPLERMAAWDAQDAQAARSLLEPMAHHWSQVGRLHKETYPFAPREVLDLGAGKCVKRKIIEEVLDTTGYVGVEGLEEIAALNDDVHHMMAEDMPLERDGRFAFVWANHAMEHCLDPEATALAILRALAPYGIFGHATPHYFPDPEPAHVTQKTIDEWVEFYSRLGFVVLHAEEVEYSCKQANIVLTR